MRKTKAKTFNYHFDATTKTGLTTYVVRAKTFKEATTKLFKTSPRLTVLSAWRSTKENLPVVVE